MFKELYESYTTFTLDMDQACRDCYNVRLLKVYKHISSLSTKPNVREKYYKSEKRLPEYLYSQLQ